MATEEELARSESRRKDRELDLKEREVAAKEREVRFSILKNPLFLALVAATAALFGNIYVTQKNNENTQAIEHIRNQSNLIIEAVKTQDANTACKNLNFFVNLGFLDDSKQTIRKACPTQETGPPSLPGTGTITNLNGTASSREEVQVVDERESPIVGAIVEGDYGRCITKTSGTCYLPINCRVNEDVVHFKVSAENFVSVEPTLSCGGEGEYVHVIMKRPKQRSNPD
jgi:hypothetical protein